MNLTSLITDNVTELLVKIIEFTKIRQKILIQNINNIHSSGFTPKDLAIHEFCSVLNSAIDEHALNKRLLFYDTKNIRFGAKCCLKVQPKIDEYAKELLEENQNEYLELQIDKLLENSLNQKIAAELLRQKQEMIFDYE